MRAAILATAALMLSGCQSEAERHAAETGEIHITDATTDQVARLIKAGAAKNAVKPGMWKADLHVEALEMAGATEAERAAQLEAAQRLDRNKTECRTAEQLKPFDISKLEKAAGECTFNRFDSASGKVQADVICKKAGAPDTRITIDGTSSPTGFDVRTESRTGTEGQPGYSLIKLRSKGARIGDCPA